jgi:tetratricopeptide (TPR) repeat protein
VGSFEDVRRLVAEMARRRVFQVVAVYGGGAFALLQSADVVVDALSLSPTLVTTLTIIILLGFPIAIAVGWLYDLDAAGRLRRTEPAAIERDADTADDEISGSAAMPRLGWPLKVTGVATFVLFVTASWLIATRISPPEPAYAISDPRGSYLVAPVHARGESPVDLELAERAATRLMWKLRGWESVRVVQEFALTGMLYDLEIEAGRVPSLDQTFQMAQTQRVGTVVALRVTSDADSAHLEAVLYDVASRREFGPPYLQTAARDDIDELVAPVARAVLQLRDQDVGLDELRSESPVLEAHQDFFKGLDALYDWRLTVAETNFRQAIAADSLFAAAHHYLALTLYWQTARDGERVLAVGPEIARLTRTASRLADLRDLRPGLREHIEALRAFWAGDYAGARDGYSSLLERDPSDTEAWLLLGAVEFEDPYLERTADGDLRPRRNPNAARRAFERAVELSPDFQLSYGHLFSLDRELLAASVLGEGCQAFEPPDTPRLPPYLVAEAGRQIPYCPVMLDSVTWLPAASFQQVDLRAAGERTEREMRRSRVLLEDWVRIHPEQPRPHEELDGWLTWRRSMLSCSADPAQVDELTRAIRVHRESALSLRGDTTPADRARLALLRLAEEQVEDALMALTAVDAASEVPPPAAANVYLALGMTEEAISASASVYDPVSWGRQDPVDGSIILAGDVAHLVRDITMRGATGDDGPALRTSFERLMAEWTPPAYSRRQSVLLRETILRFGVAPGLVLDSVSRRAWFDGWEEHGVTMDPVWRGLSAATPADVALQRTLAWQRDARQTRAVDHFSAGMLARALGRDSIAAAQFWSVEACPLSLDAFDEGWGVRTLSRLYLARSLADLGDSAGATKAMNGFTALWRGRPEAPGNPTRR